MSNPKIPDRNLPIYLQNYNIDIVNVAFPSCQLSERGCCSDKVTPVPPDGQCPIGGCAGTEFGCCPYDTTPKSDPEGSNCQNIAGKVLYSTVGAIPSNKQDARVWQLNLSGTLKPNEQVYYFVYDFSRVQFQGKDDVTFEGSISGTINICGQVLDAKKVIGTNFYFSDNTQTLTIYVKVSKLGFRLKKESKVSYQLQIDDCQCGGYWTTKDYVFLEYKCNQCFIAEEEVVKPQANCNTDNLPSGNGGDYQAKCSACCYDKTTETLSCLCDNGSGSKPYTSLTVTPAEFDCEITNNLGVLKKTCPPS